MGNTGWHPHCRCIATTILKTEEEMAKDTERIMDGEEPLPPSSSGNYIGELPEKFTKWLEKNAVASSVTNTTDSSTSMATSVDDALRRAKDASADFQSKTEAIAKKFGATVTPVNLKSKESTERKLNEKDVAGDVNNILDLTRNTIIVRDSQDVDEIVREIGKNFSIPVINGKIRIKDQSTSMGYTGKLVNVKLNGVIGEIQINTPQMIYAKDKSVKSILPKDVFDEIERKSGPECGLGHKYYEEWRNPETTEERRRELEELSKEYYDAIRKVKL